MSGFAVNDPRQEPDGLATKSGSARGGAAMCIPAVTGPPEHTITDRTPSARRGRGIRVPVRRLPCPADHRVRQVGSAKRNPTSGAASPPVRLST